MPVTALLSTAYAGYESEMGDEVWHRYSADLRPTPETLAATLVAELDGQVVGAVRYHRSAPDELDLPTGAAMVRALAVLPTLRGPRHRPPADGGVPTPGGRRRRDQR